jgi:hypothetical protein
MLDLKSNVSDQMVDSPSSHYSARLNESGIIILFFIFLNTGRGLEDPSFSLINVAGTKFYRKPLMHHSF